MLISIIIPTLNEERYIGDLIRHLQQDSSFAQIHEILVIDGRSQDRTRSLARRYGATVVVSNVTNRAAQMNLGAVKANGTILYFLHADTLPPRGFADKISQAISAGSSSGCFRLRFNWSHWFLKANSWFTRFNFRIFRFGDQSLFVKRDAFFKVDGFKEELTLFEDQDIVARLRQVGTFELLPEYVVTSARKYRKNGPYRLQLVYFLLFLLFAMGFSQRMLVQTYRNLIPHPMM